MRYKKIIVPLENVEFDMVSKFKNKCYIHGDNIYIYVPEDKKSVVKKEKIIKGKLSKEHKKKIKITKGKLSEETKKKISEKLKGHKQSEETKQKRRETYASKRTK
jgi:hypothetical protein